MRKKFHINEKTYLKISDSKRGIFIEPLREDDAIKKNVVNFLKREKAGNFSFHSKDKRIKNITHNIDNTLY